ncbi:thialysine N-epsilon-acetyltransferase-like isoform X2 [Sceloporus undulatus]|uniref:thialysine N-epsilon-acetyltransferase-like isoform X2 n=1 Tax=Sceloporus undulatus TaxID=8520 RepID=UPI001C4BFBFB|nr:thialysine N-epsilon-acetyltransferase-like isoform X2 [Sceloporus undulatus]
MNYIIRPWAIKDLKEVMRLIRESAAFHKALDQVKTTPETFRDDGFGKEATFGCLVAEVPPEEKTKEGKGIGTNLMKKVSQIALEKGCSQFRFISDKWNQPAMNFYTKLGAVNVTDLNHWIVCHIDQPDIKKLAEQVREERSG